MYPADPPPTIVILRPLAFLDYVTAWWTLALFSIAVMIYVSFTVAREVGFSRSVAVMCSALALASSPFLFLLKRNHMESILLLLGFSGWYSLRRNRYSHVGWYWGAAGTLKSFPAVWFIAAGRSFHNPEVSHLLLSGTPVPWTALYHSVPIRSVRGRAY